ncbi:hypothetical protein V493_06587 [Pseudogymnoascus sp. VKM F-4281 (FW-2241)]|nr:hypothetical protein V493_06587 [Pseudogymnoascus sp. VKM F-4281 (FW-2241)]
MLHAAKAAARATKLDCREMEAATLGLLVEASAPIEVLASSGLTVEAMPDGGMSAGGRGVVTAARFGAAGFAGTGFAAARFAAAGFAAAGFAAAGFATARFATAGFTAARLAGGRG